MQENLLGRSILVGKEPMKGRLFVSIRINGQPKTAALGLPGSVPNSVSRCMAQQDIAHIKIDVAKDGTMTITNMKPQNITYVDGSEVMKKAITEKSRVELGSDRFPINLAEILTTASKIVDVVIPPKPKEYSIRPLRRVWNEYHQGELELKKKPQKLAQLQKLSSFFTIAGGSLYIALGRFGFKAGGPGVEHFFGALTVIGILLFAYSFFKSSRSKTVEEAEALKKRFQKRYVCPNPKCHHYVGGLGDYDLLRQNKNCPYCKCVWTEK